MNGLLDFISTGPVELPWARNKRKLLFFDNMDFIDPSKRGMRPGVGWVIVYYSAIRTFHECPVGDKANIMQKGIRNYRSTAVIELLHETLKSAPCFNQKVPRVIT